MIGPIAQAAAKRIADKQGSGQDSGPHGCTQANGQIRSAVIIEAVEQQTRSGHSTIVRFAPESSRYRTPVLVEVASCSPSVVLSGPAHRRVAVPLAAAAFKDELPPCCSMIAETLRICRRSRTHVRSRSSQHVLHDSRGWKEIRPYRLRRTIDPRISTVLGIGGPTGAGQLLSWTYAVRAKNFPNVRDGRTRIWRRV